jgi:hypothetical protein
MATQHRWTSREVNRAIYMFTKGASYRNIAEVLQMTPYAVREQLRRHGYRRITQGLGRFHAANRSS